MCVATYSLAGAITGRSTPTAVIDISNKSNDPSATDGPVSRYVNPSAPAGGTSAGVAGLPNSPDAALTPYLRTSFTSTPNGSSGVLLTVPTGSGILSGDLMVAFVVTSFTSTLALMTTWLASGWTRVAGTQDGGTNDSFSVWVRTATATEDGRSWGLSGGSNSVQAQIRVYGNATFDSATITEIAPDGSGNTPVPALTTAKPGGLVAYAWGGNCGATPVLRATIPSPLINVRLDLGVNYTGIVSAGLPVVSATQPGWVAVLGTNGSFGKQFQASVSLSPLKVFRFASVSLEESIGASRDTVKLTSRLHILGGDLHSPQTDYGFVTSGLNNPNATPVPPTSPGSTLYPGMTTFPGNGTLTAYSYERWVRVRFDPDFNTVRGFRFWAPNLTGVIPGWSVKYGTTSTYRAPSNNPSSIATTSVPTSDPGRDTPNAGGASRLTGTGTQYSDWIVLQASADLTVVSHGPVLGFSLEGTLIPIEFAFAWTES